MASSGASATIVVRVFGPELDVLRDRANEVARSIADVEGVVDLKVEPQVLVPQLEVRLRPEAAARFGLTAGHIRRAATTLTKGREVGEVYEGQKIYDVVVKEISMVDNYRAQFDRVIQKSSYEELIVKIKNRTGSPGDS